MVDYESVPLYKDEDRIAWPRVVGLGWEKAVKASDVVGPWGLTEADLGGGVTLCGVKHRGTVQVSLTKKDCVLVVSINKAIHSFFDEYKLVRVGAPDQNLRSPKGTYLLDEKGKRYAHDLVVQRVGSSRRWSVEVKVINRTHFKGLLKARGFKQKDALKLYKRLPETAESDRWMGRMLIMVWARDDRVNFSLKVDLYPEAQQEWIGFHGWQGVAAPVCGLQQQRPTPPPKETPKEEKTSPQPAAHMRGQKREWVDVEKELFPEAKKRQFFAFKGQQVCRATEAFNAAKLPKLHIAQDLKCWAKKDNPRWYLDTDFGQAAPHPAGGPQVWCVTRRVAHFLYWKQR